MVSSDAELKFKLIVNLKTSMIGSQSIPKTFSSEGRLIRISFLGLGYSSLRPDTIQCLILKFPFFNILSMLPIVTEPCHQQLLSVIILHSSGNLSSDRLAVFFSAAMAIALLGLSPNATVFNK